MAAVSKVQNGVPLNRWLQEGGWKMIAQAVATIAVPIFTVYFGKFVLWIIQDSHAKYAAGNTIVRMYWNGIYTGSRPYGLGDVIGSYWTGFALTVGYVGGLGALYSYFSGRRF